MLGPGLHAENPPRATHSRNSGRAWGVNMCTPRSQDRPFDEINPSVDTGQLAAPRALLPARYKLLTAPLIDLRFNLLEAFPSPCPPVRMNPPAQGSCHGLYHSTDGGTCLSQMPGAWSVTSMNLPLVE